MTEPAFRQSPISPLKVAVVAACPFPARRGTPLRIERLTEALVARGHEVELVTYHLAESDEPKPFKVHRIFGRTELRGLAPGPTLGKLVRFDPALAVLLRKVLREGSFDVIHAHHFEGLLVAAAARGRSGIPIVYDAHTMLGSELPTYRFGMPSRAVGLVGDWMDKHVPRLADHVVCVTPDIRDRLVRRHGFDPSSITVALNGVEAERFVAIDPAAAVPDTLIYSGTLAEYQGVGLLLKAFARARQVRPSLRLVMAVSDPFAPYEGLARQLAVRDAIEVEDGDFERLPERLARASIAVLPRVACDGIPQKLLNYMAAGKPVVAFKGSAKVLENERNGLVIANGDIEAFAQGLLRLARDPELSRALGRAARDYVLDVCTWERTAARCESAYARLVGEPADDHGGDGAQPVLAVPEVS